MKLVSGAERRVITLWLLAKRAAVAESVVAQLLRLVEERLRCVAVLKGLGTVSILGDAGAADDLGDARVVQDCIDGQLGEISVGAVCDQFPAETHCLEYLVGERVSEEVWKDVESGLVKFSAVVGEALLAL
jgi:hypothetical protein